MTTDKPRYTVSVDSDLFKKIEDYRYENRFKTRADATVDLIKAGIASLYGEDAEGIGPARQYLDFEIDPQVIEALRNQPLVRELLEQLISLPANKRKEALNSITSYMEVLAASEKK